MKIQGASQDKGLEKLIENVNKAILAATQLSVKNIKIKGSYKVGEVEKVIFDDTVAYKSGTIELDNIEKKVREIAGSIYDVKSWKNNVMTNVAPFDDAPARMLLKDYYGHRLTFSKALKGGGGIDPNAAVSNFAKTLEKQLNETVTVNDVPKKRLAIPLKDYYSRNFLFPLSSSNKNGELFWEEEDYFLGEKITCTYIGLTNSQNVVKDKLRVSCSKKRGLSACSSACLCGGSGQNSRGSGNRKR